MKFYNISNHPSSRWSAEQLNAARALGGEVVDVSFPNVDPSATTAEVLALLAPIMAQVSQPSVGSFAFVAGEQTLVFSLLLALQERGVRLVTATTERVGVETMQPDGSIKKEFVFKFVQWRQLW